MKARITSHSPVLLVNDVDESVKWYCEKCGFNLKSTYGEPSHFAIIQRDGNHLMFAVCDKSKIVPNWKNAEKISNVYFWTDNAEELYNEFRESGATIDWDLCIQPYGVKEFGINDPDGYDIAFGEILKN
ncbi:MAG TPA: VOC family protein [Ignavibacteria bacterium]|nr:VOC family protein [Ignavibacteria bacterium]HMR40113.1 VOC family protein [Ignavibacteria bacterium]